MKKIIFVIDEFLTGGVETSFINLIKNGLNDNYDIELHILNQNHEIMLNMPEKVKIVHIKNNINILSDSLKKDFKAMLLNKDLLYLLKRIIISIGYRFGKNYDLLIADYLFPNQESNSCDVCIVLKENEPTLYYALKKIESSKTVCFFHTAAYLNKKYAVIYQSKAVEEILTVSEGNKQFLVEKMPKTEPKIKVIHNIVPQQEIREKAECTVEIEGFLNSAFNIISVCRINKEKGIDTIVSTAERLNARGIEFKWYVLGPFDHGNTEEYWENICRTKKIEDKLIFLGECKNPYPYIKKASLLVNASRIESFGMAIREAQILGTPVISTDTYGGNELIVDNITGVIVPVDDDKKMADEIEKFIDDSEVLARFKKNLMKEKFDETDKIKMQFAEVINRGV